MLEIKNLSYCYGEHKVLDDVSFDVKQGEFLSIMGPNGSGKTTLLRAILGLSEGVQVGGEIFLKEKPIRDYSQKELAKIIAVVFQNNSLEFDFSVREIVAMGRYPYIGRFANESKEDAEIIERAMRETGVLEFKDRSYKEISGGEAQRMMIARALTQEPEILILDEPVNHLDLKYSTEILKLLKRLNEEKNITIITILHDLNLASLFSDSILFIKDGVAHAKEKPVDCINTENIKEIYEVDVMLNKYNGTDKLYVMPRI